ncbi:MAG TPA: hypothetical protein VNZ94_00360 [Xanthobacteraceae bacterium]|nr:hypothetical protein [Xanthobacteraceae bacterium]
MRCSPNDLLNQETGQIDWTAVKAVGLARAVRDYGAMNPPTSWVRDGLRWARDRAFIMQCQWRERHGLPDLTIHVTIHAYGSKKPFSLRPEF